MIPSLPHENDGLIFTPVYAPYIKGTCKQLFKWKPAGLNSVDFRILLAQDYSNRNDVWELWAGDRGVNRFYGLFYLDFER